MKKIITSLSALTLSLIPTVGVINSNSYSENTNYLQVEKENESSVCYSKLIGKNEDEKSAITKELINSILHLDSQKINEILNIIKEKQAEEKDAKSEIDFWEMLEEMSLYAIENIKFSVSLMVEELGSYVVHKTKAALVKTIEGAAFFVATKALSFSKNQLKKLVLKFNTVM